MFVLLFGVALAEDISYNINHYPFEGTYTYKVNNIYNKSTYFSLEGSMIYSDAKLCSLRGDDCSITRDMDNEESAQLVIKTTIYEKSNTTQENITLSTGQEKVQFNIYYLYGDATDDQLLKISKWVSGVSGQPINKVEYAIKIIIVLLALYAVAKLLGFI